MDVHSQGFAILEGVLAENLCRDLSRQIDSAIGKSPPTAGTRDLFERCPELRALIHQTEIRDLVDPVLGDTAFAVRAILFDKTPAANWLVSWHQDVTIAVQSRCDVDGFDRWSTKAGIVHVSPPPSVLQRMVTLRIHLDACGPENGLLRVLPGSHRQGKLSAAEIQALAATVDPVNCTVGRGGCIVMSPLAVHASSKAIKPNRRRVLHIEFASTELPPPLEWHERY